MSGGGAMTLEQLTRDQLRAALLLVDEAVEFAGKEATCFPGRERLNRGLSQKGAS